MNNKINPQALFRLSVLGSLASRDQLNRGELKTIISKLANQTYNIPNSKRVHLSPQTIEHWYYAWKRNGIDGLVPKSRCDKNKTHLAENVKNALLEAKQKNPARSINTLILLLEQQGIVAKGELARATVHRFLKSKELSKRTLADAVTIERRSFVAAHAGDIWYGDVMYGPSISTSQGMRKVYLVSLLDDASRLIAHSAFCFGETALDIESVLKQGLLKRGLPKKLIIDNGPAYRAHSLQNICAKLGIRLVFCRPYEPEGKGKIERYHRTLRESFLNELNIQSIQNLDDLNARLWAWTEHIYHNRPHAGLNKQTPLERWRQDLIHIKPLSSIKDFDKAFYHSVSRFVRKDGTILWEGKLFEVPYECSQKKVTLIFDPHDHKPLRIESDSGDNLGLVTPFDPLTNINRKRQRPNLNHTAKISDINTVDLALSDYKRAIGTINKEEN